MRSTRLKTISFAAHMHYSQLLTILNNIVTPDSGSTILFNIVDKCGQRGQQNIVQSC